jgi:hypothetical protein
MYVRLFKFALLASTAISLNAQSQTTCAVSIPNNRQYTDVELSPLVVGKRRTPGELKASTPFFWRLGNHGNEFHSLDLPQDGKIFFKVQDLNDSDTTEVLSLRLSWWRLVEGPLTFEGRRPSGAFQAFPSSGTIGYGKIGFQPVSVKLPSAGCWEITGHTGNRSLTFVVDVVKVTEWPKSDQQ